MGLPSDRRGFVLVITAVLLLSLTVIVAAFVSMLVVRTRSGAGGLNSSKAFWTAEAGLQQAVYRLKNDVAYRSAPTTLNGTLNGGTYTVTVTKQSSVYLLSCAGSVGGVTRTLTQTLALTVSGGWPAAFTDYGAFTGTGGISLSTSARIVGDAYTLGTVTTNSQAAVTGIVYANSGSGNYKRLPLPVPGISMPVLDTSYYTGLINTARTQKSGNKTYTNLNLAGSTVYVNGTVTATTITGPGTIVSTGNFVCAGTVSQNVTIITNAGLSFSKSCTVQSGSILYATTGVSIANTGLSISNSSLLTPGAVTISQDMSFSGALYCGGNLTSSSKTLASLTGAVVCNGIITLGKADTLTQDSTRLPVSAPAGLGTVASLVLSNWNE